MPPEYVAHYPRFHKKYRHEQVFAFKTLTAQKTAQGSINHTAGLNYECYARIEEGEVGLLGASYVPGALQF